MISELFENIGDINRDILRARNTFFYFGSIQKYTSNMVFVVINIFSTYIIVKANVETEAQLLLRLKCSICLKILG